MVFHSVQYLLFLPLTLLFFHWTPARWRWGVLLLASLAFYAAWGIPYLLLVLAWVIGVSYLAGLGLRAVADPRRQKWLLALGVLANLAPLFALRYLPLLAGWADFPPLTTLGVSFYSFQAISYLVDIYLELLEPERHPGVFALYLSFFPKLIQGPIERGGSLLPQLRQLSGFDYARARDGLLQIGWGVFKKLVLADRLAIYVNGVYGQVREHSGPPLILATFLYAFQIYFDFSAYTDIALGSARLFNLELTQNFKSPYLASSVADFWRRWHISFSRWILDYIFKPLQMYWRRGRQWGTAAALLVTFLASGVWHGARWGFVIWGLLHGLYLVFELLTAPLEKRLLARLKLSKSRWIKAWKIFLTFLLVCFSWIFFRADSLQDALYVVSQLFSGLEDSLRQLVRGEGISALLRPWVAEARAVGLGTWALLAGMALLSWLNHRVGGRQYILRQHWLVRWGVYYLLVGTVLVLGVFGDSRFIYFQF